MGAYRAAVQESVTFEQHSAILRFMSFHKGSLRCWPDGRFDRKWTSTALLRCRRSANHGVGISAVDVNLYRPERHSRFGGGVKCKFQNPKKGGWGVRSPSGCERSPKLARSSKTSPFKSGEPLESFPEEGKESPTQEVTLPLPLAALRWSDIKTTPAQTSA